jgi:surfactin synthase thioesterase subunit
MRQQPSLICAEGTPVSEAHAVDVPRVFCFPHAGGDARRFLEWQPALAADAELIAVSSPGRGRATADPVAALVQIIEDAAAAIRKLDDRPIYLFGHSFGAVVAFEVARRLDGLSALRHLIASGIAAPSLLPSQRITDLARLEGPAFAEALGFFGGLPPELVVDRDLQELLLPRLIADFRLAASYRFTPGPALKTPVTLINGDADPHIGSAQVQPWHELCAAAPVVRWADGGHFYFERRPTAVIELIRGAILADQHVETI